MRQRWNSTLVQILVVVANVQWSVWTLKAGEEKVSVWTAKAHGLGGYQSFTVNCVCMVSFGAVA